MRIFRAFANPIQQPSFDQVDGGSGGGASGGSGQGGGQGGNLGGGAGAGNLGGNTTPVSLADDTPISIDGKTTTWKEYRAGNFVPKSEYDNVRNLTKQEIEGNLRKIAARLQQQRGQQQPQQQQQQRVDPFAKVRGLPLVDGDTLAQLAESGFGQIGQTIQQQQQQIQQLVGQLKKLQGGVGTLAKERSGQERTQRVTQAIASLGEGYDTKDPLLNDVAQDLIDAWEFNSEPEFHKMFADRIGAFEKFIRARDAAKLKAAKERRFVRPGGNATPSGQARPDPRVAASQAADILFGPRQGART